MRDLKETFLIYDMPSITEFISIGWLQTIIARYTAWKVGRKIRRWNKRVERAEYIKKFLAHKNYELEETFEERTVRKLDKDILDQLLDHKNDEL